MTEHCLFWAGEHWSPYAEDQKRPLRCVVGLHRYGQHRPGYRVTNHGLEACVLPSVICNDCGRWKS